LLIDGLPIAEWGGGARPFFAPCNKKGRPVERPSPDQQPAIRQSAIVNQQSVNQQSSIDNS